LNSTRRRLYPVIDAETSYSDRLKSGSLTNFVLLRRFSITIAAGIYHGKYQQIVSIISSYIK